jgi:hypothetical protein
MFNAKSVVKYKTDPHDITEISDQSICNEIHSIIMFHCKDKVELHTLF